MLTVTDVDVFIQTSHILRHVSLEVGAREVICLVGRNGSGKTTTLRTIMSYHRPRAGRAEFRGQPIHGRPILIAESNIHHVPDYTTRLYVIERGEIIFDGPPDDAWRDTTVSRIIGGAPR